MKFFLDSADTEEIARFEKTGIIDGVTTNPSLIYRSGRPFKEVVERICEIVKGPVSVETISESPEGMIKEGQGLMEIADNIVVKLPTTLEAVEACKKLAELNIAVNMTLCFSATQALIAAKAGASYVSPFIGRLDDSNIDGIGLIREIRSIYEIHNFKTEILAASIRTKNHVSQSALAGAHVATIPPKIFATLINHPLTEIGLETFNSDWQKSGQKLL